ncbi:hypothetical protein QVD17_09264 [Tagetes erecta]|uniref:Transmembrane protein n=1 Tax=Tagetes erecta TaxID=13708 RepID=A0AAD8L3K3_TARER|nr:hypothetical protein QVD17_09264 [Tagetes erecta]
MHACNRQEMEGNVEYGWGVGSVVAMLLVVGCLLFLPIGLIGPLAPPPLPLVLLIPVLLIIMIIFLSNASN